MEKFSKNRFKNSNHKKGRGRPWAFYMWGVNPEEKKEIPRENLESNEKYFDPVIVDYPQPYLELLDDHPRLKQIWDLLPHWVMKADLARLLLVYEYGGFYFDVDCRLERDITSRISRRKTVLFVEDILDTVEKLGERECRDPGREVRISNFAFGSAVPRNLFFKEAIDESVRRIEVLAKENRLERISRQEILWSTGPDVITSVYHLRKNQDQAQDQDQISDICLLPQDCFSHFCMNSWVDNPGPGNNFFHRVIKFFSTKLYPFFM